MRRNNLEDNYKIAIIGGGASGLFAGSILGKKAIVLERGDRCGRKLLLTGKGRCNYTTSTPIIDLFEHYNGEKNFMRPALYALPPEKIIERFKSFGIEPSFEERNKVFPLNGDSKSILDALYARCNIVTNCFVKSIKKENTFLIETTKGNITADNIILATGGNSYCQTGSDGYGYTLAKSFGHRIISPSPALAPLWLSKDLSKAEGISIDISVKIEKKEYRGDVVITKAGLSGPLAEDISYMFHTEREITISFSDIDILKIRKNNAKSNVKNALDLPDRLIKALIGDLADKKIAELKKDEENFIINQLTSLKCKARAIASGAMSTHGGISTDEINPKTMESRIVSGLYFAGDIINVDANCGGYSLTWAFATAKVASDSILKDLNL